MQKVNQKKYNKIVPKEGAHFEWLLENNSKIVKELDEWIAHVGGNTASTQQSILQVLSCIQEYYIQDFVSYQGVPNILIHIEQIGFPSLTLLNLGDSKICTLEVLPRIYMPKIKRFWIDGNRILSLKPLRKTNFPEFEILRIQENKFKECKELSEANFPVLRVLQIQRNPAYTCGPDNLDFLLKLNTGNMTSIYASRISRIKKISHRQKLKEKYKNAKLNFWK